MSDTLNVDGGILYDRIFRNFILGGDCACLGADATVTYLALQAFCSWKDGIAEVSVSTLSRLTAISPTGIHRALDVLKAAEFIRQLSSAPGKKGRYEIIHWIMGQNDCGEQIPLSWKYIPDDEPELYKNLQKFVRTGGQPPPSINIHVHVDQLQLVNSGGQGVQVMVKEDRDATSQKALKWFKTLHPSEWSAALLQAGVTSSGKISTQSKVAAWLAAGAPDA